jgi:hypothetical protein
MCYSCVDLTTTPPTAQLRTITWRMAACTSVSNRFEFGWIDNLFAFEIVNLRV